ncbi:hypothetical protein BJ875DRAFT_525122 [Amylocarpus encephaloides]|uniref:DNA/RNA-binding domain-containing protein n=1 Tax=Amylocarpus encephaloides TaxID=45428 RepID=A0A9P7Y850_9HELO|nr:hypothetical protein BJ875DRAFT_525122 [Amylocarpus encephaloides]
MQPQRTIFGFDQLWIQHQRRRAKTTKTWACTHCPDCRIFTNTEDLWHHALRNHQEMLPSDESELQIFRTKFEAESLEKRTKHTLEPRNPTFHEEPPPSKRPLSSSRAQDLAGQLKELNIYTSSGSDVTIQDLLDENENGKPRKKRAVGEGISAAGSVSPFRDSVSPPPQSNTKARPNRMSKKQLWAPQDAPLSFEIAAVQAPRSRGGQAPRSRGQAQRSRGGQAPRSRGQAQRSRGQALPAIFPRSSIQGLQGPSQEESFDIILQLQPETTPISQEQLVAEVEAIFAGLVMVEAKCIEVDNKQAALAQADAGNPPKLNIEQWQALIALHRTLLHEHYDFFLASQHPLASPALRQLASTHAMPTRMWRHGIHSFLELLRYRLPDSLDHMLAFIYLAYSMMALLYETVPTFKDTWVECLGDLGRYRMAIEGDDIRDREVWAGVVRHWYSIASDNSPKTGRLYHHLAILARPNVLQQLFFYAKSLCVAIPFTFTRELILTLFEPVLDSDRFDPVVKEFLGLLDTQIGRVTIKFMEQGYHIAVANKDVTITNAPESDSMATFKYAQSLSNATTEIVLKRVGDPNVLPFIHVTLVFMLFIARHPSTIKLLEAEFPWKSLAIMLNTILGSYQTPSRIEDSVFPQLEKDDPHPFPEDFAIRELVWTEGYFPADFFTKKIDEEEKYHERALMTSQRKERILWLACRIASLVPVGMRVFKWHLIMWSLDS